MATQFDKVYAAMLSDMGPLASPQALDFRVNQEFTVDFTETLQRNFIDYISGCYVNNWDGEFDIHIATDFPDQHIIVPQYSWAYLPLLIANPAKLTLTTPDGVIGAFVTSVFYNIPLAPYVQRRYAAPAAP